MSSVLELSKLLQSNSILGALEKSFKSDLVQVRAIENRARVVPPNNKGMLDEECSNMQITPFYLASRFHTVGCGESSDVTGIQAACADLVKNWDGSSDEGSGFSSHGFEQFDIYLFKTARTVKHLSRLGSEYI